VNISVIVATYGEERWGVLADSRAVPSAHIPGISEIVAVHMENGNLASARNTGARKAQNEWLCFLDADDELDAMFGMAMGAALLTGAGEDKPLLTPMVSYRRGAKWAPPKFWKEVPIEQGNWLIIGTLIHRDVFNEVGGFEDWPMYEDWALFARAQKAGTEVVKVPDAIYRAHYNPRGRNKRGLNESRRAGDMIRRAVFPELYDEEE